MSGPPEDPRAWRSWDVYALEVRLVDRLRARTPWTWVLVTLCVGVAVVGSAYEAGLAAKEGLSIPASLSLVFGMKENALIEGGQWWRLLTSAFLHAGWMHLAFNALALVYVGGLVERLVGRWPWWVLFVTSALGGAVSSWQWTEAPAVGASGAVFGYLGALLVYGFVHRRTLPAALARRLTWGLLPWVVLNLAFGLWPGVRIDNAAHVGGMVVGALLALALPDPWGRRVSPWWRWAGWALGVLVLVAVGAWLWEVARCGSSLDAINRCYGDVLGALEAGE